MAVRIRNFLGPLSALFFAAAPLLVSGKLRGKEKIEWRDSPKSKPSSELPAMSSSIKLKFSHYVLSLKPPTLYSTSLN